MAKEPLEQLMQSLEEAFLHARSLVLVTEAEPVSPPGPRIVFANEAFLAHSGYSLAEVVGRTPRLFQGAKTDRAALARIRAAMQAGEGCYEELVNYAKDGKEYYLGLDIVPISTDSRPVYYISIGRDLTQAKNDAHTREALQERLFQSQRMESVAVLAGGVAHDFNNILTGILGSAEMAKMSLERTHPAYQDLDTILQASQRAATLAKELLAYTGSGKGARDLVSLNELVTSMLIILRSQMPKSIIVRKALMPDVPKVEADVAQLQQVVLNLCLNASEAMAGQGGVLSVTTDQAIVDQAQCRRLAYGPSAPGVYAVFEVHDTGHGMSAEMQRAAFEPFYTSHHEGRGLGLAAALRIVRAHGGGIEVISAEGEGSTFRVYLPASSRSMPKAPSAEPGTPRGKQTVLFVDDEEMLRSLARRALEHLGYRVMLAADGIEAVRIYREHAQEIDLVILDLSMPRQGGEDAYQEMRDIRNDMRVLLCCGYDESMANRRIAADNLVGFLPKPFSLEVLAQAVHAGLRPR